MSNELNVHNIAQGQTLSHVELSAGTVIENIQLTDKVAQVEKTQFLEWFKDRYENYGDLVGTAQQLADAVSDGLAGVVTPEAIEIIIRIIKGL
mgnify:CR=1 FL=1